MYVCTRALYTFSYTVLGSIGGPAGVAELYELEGERVVHLWRLDGDGMRVVGAAAALTYEFQSAEDRGQFRRLVTNLQNGVRDGARAADYPNAVLRTVGLRSRL